MSGHDIIVLGSSAGGVKALTSIVRDLPGDLAAAVFIVQHVAAGRPSLLPQILNDVGALRAAHARQGEPIVSGRIYVAPPDHHLLLGRCEISVVRGPQENRFRPSIDALFRSAARFHGSRVVGVVLTGALDDGTIGLQAIKARGGITAAQDPREAEYPSMPVNALRYASPEYVLALTDIPDFIVRMTREPAPDPDRYPIRRDLEVEARIAEQDLQGKDMLASMDAIGKRTPYSCPSCNGVLWQIGSAEPLRFRCHTGHAFTRDALLASQNEQLEQALWSALRLMEEKATFYRQLRDQPENEGELWKAGEYDRAAAALEAEALALRALLLRGEVTAPAGDSGTNQTESPPISLVPESEAYR